MLLLQVSHARKLLGIVFFFLAYYGLSMYFIPIYHWVDSFFHFSTLSYGLTEVITGLPIVIGTQVLHGNYRFWRYLGLEADVWLGIRVALLFTLPMLLGGWIFFSFNGDVTMARILKAALLAGFFEELYFRGFLFGQLYRYTRLGFIPAILLSAVLFASGHLYQSSDPGTMAGIFLTTFMGSVFFAWLFVEWKYNLWLPVFLHAFMNLSWECFTSNETALGDVASNVFRVMTITAAIVSTIVYKKRKGLPLEIGKINLLWKPSV